MKRLFPPVPCLCIVMVLTSFETVEGAAGRIVTGVDTSAAAPHVKAFTTRTQTEVASFFAYPVAFKGGVRVAAGDVNGDGGPDIITGTGPGAAHVKVFAGSGLTEVHSFLPYGANFSGGVFVAAGDVNGDGAADIVTGADAGAGPHVKVFDGRTGAEFRSFFAYPVSFTGGVRVAAGDVNGDGVADIITGTGPGGGPHVKVFDGTSLAELHSFFAYNVSFTGGVFVAAGDVNGDGLADIITGAGAGGGPQVKVFDGTTHAQIQSFLAYEAQFTGGVTVASGDVDGDDLAEIVTGPGSGLPAQVRVIDATTLRERASFLSYPVTFTNGVFVAAASLKRPRLEAGSDPRSGDIRLAWPAGSLCVLEGNPATDNPNGWGTVDTQPVQNGDRFEVVLRPDQGSRFFRLKCDDEALP